MSKNVLKGKDKKQKQRGACSAKQWSLFSDTCRRSEMWGSQNNSDSEESALNEGSCKVQTAMLPIWQCQMRTIYKDCWRLIIIHQHENMKLVYETQKAYSCVPGSAGAHSNKTAATWKKIEAAKFQLPICKTQLMINLSFLGFINVSDILSEHVINAEQYNLYFKYIQCTLIRACD